MIIFCKNCTHYQRNRIHNDCAHQSNIQIDICYDNYKYSNKQKPEIINKDNNCVNFNGSILYKIKRFLFKSKD